MKLTIGLLLFSFVALTFAEYLCMHDADCAHQCFFQMEMSHQCRDHTCHCFVLSGVDRRQTCAEHGACTCADGTTGHCDHAGVCHCHH